AVGGRDTCRCAGRSDASRGPRIKRGRAATGRSTDQRRSQPHTFRTTDGAISALHRRGQSCGRGVFPAADFKRRTATRGPSRTIVQRRGSGAVSADHAADSRRTRLPAGKTLSFGVGAAEDGARTAPAASRTVAERSGRDGRPEAAWQAGDGSRNQKGRVTRLAVWQCFPVRGRFGAEKRVETRDVGGGGPGR